MSSLEEYAKEHFTYKEMCDHDGCGDWFVPQHVRKEDGRVVVSDDEGHERVVREPNNRRIAKSKMVKECIDFAEGDKETAVELAREVYEYFLNLSEPKFRGKNDD